VSATASASPSTALDLRLTAPARSTKDIDIEWRAGEEEPLDAASHDAGDFFAFAIERAGVPEDRLGFAGIKPVEVDAIPLELQVAESSTPTPASMKADARALAPRI
jgi:hypothetical protein